MRKVLFFLGKGGVGKSTISSATAYQLSNIGMKTLIVSLDPAHNLCDIFRMAIGDNIINVKENLDAMEINLSKWTEKYIDDCQEEIKSTYIHNSAFNIQSYINILKYSPGVEEYAVIWGIEHIYKNYSSMYDYIIFDTPPTALTLRFLAMPSISLVWVKQLNEMRNKILKDRASIIKNNPEASIIKGATKREDDKVSLKLDFINERLSYINELFLKESYISIVLNPDELSLAESIRIKDELDNLNVKLDSLILNKLKGKNEEVISKINNNFKNLKIICSQIIEEGINKIEELEKITISELITQFCDKHKISK